MEVVFGIMEKLLKENIRVAKCKMPKEEPSRQEGQIVEKWECHENFYLFDNSKMLRRYQTRWKPPTLTQFKLNFNCASKGGIGEAGGVLQNGNGDALLVYTRKVGNGSNNLAKAMDFFFGSSAN